MIVKVVFGLKAQASGTGEHGVLDIMEHAMVTVEVEVPTETIQRQIQSRMLSIESVLGVTFGLPVITCYAASRPLSQTPYESATHNPDGTEKGQRQ